MDAVELDVRYEAGHSHRERWERSDLYCPKCGLRTVWRCSGEGDYYLGADHLCHNCGTVACLDNADMSVSIKAQQSLVAIRTALGLGTDDWNAPI